MSVFERLGFSRLNSKDSGAGSGAAGGETVENGGDNNVAKWNNLGQEVPFGNAEAAKNAELEQRERDRQYRKIVAAMKYDPRYLNSPDVTLPDGAMEEFERDLNDGTIDEAQQKRFLTMIASPARKIGVENLNSRLGPDKHMRRILGYAMEGKYGFGAYNNALSSDYLQNFVMKYQTPFDFEQTKDDLLEAIRAGSGEQKYQEYAADMEKFQKTVFGKRYEYYLRLKELKHDSAKDDDATEYIEEDVEMTPYSIAEQEKIISESIIDGDPFNYRGQYYQLTPEILKQQGLSPKEKVIVDGTEIGVSNKFLVGRHEAFLGYVKADDGYKVRGYYRSNSQGLWRYLPDYVMTEDGQSNNGIAWYGKAYTEGMVTLPSELQSKLSELAKENPIKLDTLPDFILGGTAKVYKSRFEYQIAIHQHTLRGDLYQEVNRLPSVDFGIVSREKDPPEDLKVQEAQEPDFGNELIAWDSNTAIYGKLSNRVYESHDKSLKYTFSQDVRGRCFVSNIETNGKITSTGVRSEWVSGGDLETPLYEYPVQSDGYGDENDRRGGVCINVGTLFVKNENYQRLFS